MKYVILFLFCCAVVSAAPVQTVTDFGAVGDGVADDTTAIQRAADASGPLVFPAGTFRLTAPVVIRLNETGYKGITGAVGTTCILMEGAGPAFHIIGTHGGTANPASVTPEIWEKERFPLIKDLEIVGAHGEAEGIVLEGTMKCTITHVVVRKCLYGIHLINRNRNFILAECHLYENKVTGLFLDNVNLHQTNIIGNHISYNAFAGIHVLNGEVRDIQITGNDIEYNDDAEADAADVLFDTREGTLREFTICSNTIQARTGPGGANVRILGEPVDVADRSGLGSITGNLIASQTTNIDLQHTRGVTVSGNSLYSGADLSIHARYCKNLTIAGNNVDYNPSVEDQMRDGFMLENCRGASITGNTLNDCRWGTQDQGGAITLLNSQQIIVSSCLITDPAVRGIHVINCDSCRVVENIIQDTRDPLRMIDAIRVDDASTDVHVANNTTCEKKE